MEAAAGFIFSKKKVAHFDPMMLWLLLYTVCKRERVSRLVQVERRGTVGNRGIWRIWTATTQSMMFFHLAISALAGLSSL